MGIADQGIPIIGPILNKIIGTRNERFVRRYVARVESINALEPTIRALSDAELRAKKDEFRDRIAGGTKAIDVMEEAFAVAREAMDRAVGIRNIFNPEHGFDPGALPEAVRPLYEKTKAEMEACEPAAPEGADLGCVVPTPGWLQVDIPLEIYEAVRALHPESRPPYRSRPFDVQLIGAMVLYQGKIAEMKTGEGKTIVAPLAAYLAATERRRIHVVTVNDYLVQRDRDWVFPFFRALGLTVGAIHPSHMQSEDEKRRMYHCDVVYGTTSEFGFDYLRDNMKRSVEQQVQRRRQFAIVDEVDSILIDEARTPLIISGPAHENQPRYELADDLARHLVESQKQWQRGDDRVQECKRRIKGLEGDIRNARDKDKIPALQEQLEQAKARLPDLERDRDEHTQYYEVQEDRKQVHLTHEGVAEAQRKAGVGSLYVDENMDLPHLLEQSLRAHVVYQLDRDYVIMDSPDRMTGKTEPTIVIVDTFTGRPMIGRQWSDGLHQAIEAKEKVPVKPETQTVATITIQNFFKMYKQLAGMTGTADTEAQEFHDIYHLDVVSIPTNMPMIRSDFDDLMFLSAKDKWEAIVDEIKAFHDVGRPILVGTTSVEKSEMLSKMLTRKYGIQHEVLNAKQHEHEAHIIENAGQLGAVMIATNMAGRGTDIKLGDCSPGLLREHWLRRGICPRTIEDEADDQALREAIFRKVAPRELGIAKRQVEQTPFDELELQLLRHWTLANTWIGSERKIQQMGREELESELDATGRFLLHRIRWFETIEQMGGLHVIGTERHESRRIDNQLRGRSGRQGDRGSSRFFVSLEDDLMKMFAGETQMKILSKLGMKEGDAIEHPWLSKSVERAQRKVEERNFQIRKNILEYDEVMEHQRQTFYGLRQRALEGRDVKGLVFEYIAEAIADAAEEMLDKDYPAQCAAEHAKTCLDCSILAERLRGKEAVQMDRLIRDDAKADVRSMIDVTLGEYIPMESSEVSVDFDSAGLINWARSRFGVELAGADIREGGARQRRHVQDLLIEAAERKIDETDLSGIDEFLVPDFGARKLAEWAEAKFGVEVAPEEIREAQTDEQRSPEDVILDKARQLYAKREIEYPIEFVMEMTMFLMRQDPAQAAGNLAQWARTRYGLDWTEETIKGSAPQKIRDDLLAASRAFVESGRLEREIKEAQACTTDAELDEHLAERFGTGLPDWMRDLEGQERLDAIQGRVETILRAELLQLERTVLLETLDNTWKDHLYAMDQLRDAISFRAFSQRDPRIEFKREGSALFLEMLDSVRDRITDFIFKARLALPSLPAAPRPQPAPARVPTGAGIAGSSISGPGLDAPAQPRRPAPARPMPEPSPDAAEQIEAARAARAADRSKTRRR